MARDRAFRSWLPGALLLGLASLPRLMAYDLDINSTQSIKSTAKDMLDDMLTFYHGDEPDQIPGLLPSPYYWWEAGAMMGALVEYWYYTGDDDYVNLTSDGLLAQVGDYDDYMPREQALNEGNDDQGFWAMAVMSAAEYNFPHPGNDEPEWLALAQAVFNTQAARWDMENCNGGLRWQIFHWNRGWDYKNTISQGTFFALAARLALFTGNDTYAEWAVRTWDWMIGVAFIDENWYVYDGAHIPNNCTEIIPYQWSYNTAIFILGAAAMYNYTEEVAWKDRLDGLLEGSKVFFTGPDRNIMEEVACESVKLCNVDQQSFKAYLSRWYAAITKWAPDTYDFVIPYLRASAVAAAKNCRGGDNGRMCGLVWNKDGFDGLMGVGQQMAAMEVTLSCMIEERKPALTQGTGGTSGGDPGGGGADIGRIEPAGPSYRKLHVGDRIGAALLTAVFAGTFLAGIFWLFLDECSDKTAMMQVKDFPTSASAAMGAFVFAGAAGTVLQKRESRGIQEKHAGVVDVSTSPENSSSDQVATPIPFVPGHVRQVSRPRHSRRASNMPLGWPHNPSLRGSVLVNPERTPESSARASVAGLPDSLQQNNRDSVLPERDSQDVSRISSAVSIEDGESRRAEQPQHDDQIRPVSPMN